MILLDRRLPARSQTGRCYANGELLCARWLLERDRRGRRLSYKTDIGVSSALFEEITAAGAAGRLTVDLRTADELWKQVRSLAKLRFPLPAPLSRHTVAHELPLAASCSRLQLALATGSSLHNAAPHCFLLLSLPILRCGWHLPHSKRTTGLKLELQLRVSVFDSRQCALPLLLMAEARELQQLSQRIAWRMEEFATGFLSGNAYRLLDASTLPEADSAQAASHSSRAEAAARAEQQTQALRLLQTVSGGLKERMSSRRLTSLEPEEAAAARAEGEPQSAGLEQGVGKEEEVEEADNVTGVDSKLTRGAWRLSLAPGSRQLRVVVALPLPVTPGVWERLMHDLQAPERGLPHPDVGSFFSSSHPSLSRLYGKQLHNGSVGFRAAHCLLSAEQLSAPLRECLSSLSRSVRFQQRQFTVQAARRLRVEYYAPPSPKINLLRLVLPCSVDCTDEEQQPQPLSVQPSAVDSFKLTVNLNIFPIVESVPQPAKDADHLSKRARQQLSRAADKLQPMLGRWLQQTGQQDAEERGDRDSQAAEQRDGAGRRKQQQVSLQQADAAPEAAAAGGDGEAGTAAVLSAAVPPAVSPSVPPQAPAPPAEPSVPPPPPPAADAVPPNPTARTPREGASFIRVPAGGGGMRGGGAAAGGGSPAMKRLRRWWRQSGFGQSVLLIMIGCVAVTYYIMTTGNFGVEKQPAAAQQAREKATGSSRKPQSPQPPPPSPSSPSSPAVEAAEPARPQH